MPSARSQRRITSSFLVGADVVLHRSHVRMYRVLAPVVGARLVSVAEMQVVFV